MISDVPVSIEQVLAMTPGQGRHKKWIDGTLTVGVQGVENVRGHLRGTVYDPNSPKHALHCWFWGRTDAPFDGKVVRIRGQGISYGERDGELSLNVPRGVEVLPIDQLLTPEQAGIGVEGAALPPTQEQVIPAPGKHSKRTVLPVEKAIVHLEPDRNIRQASLTASKYAWEAVLKAIELTGAPAAYAGTDDPDDALWGAAITRRTEVLFSVQRAMVNGYKVQRPRRETRVNQVEAAVAEQEEQEAAAAAVLLVDEPNDEVVAEGPTT